MRGLTILGFALGALGVFGKECDNAENGHCSAKKFNQDSGWEDATSIYDFHARDIHGNDVPLDKYRGHVSIIINVASKCGLTDTNYRQLVDLHKKYGESQGLAILAFPSNQFAGQEPGTSQEIFDFARGFGVEFDMFQKIDVNGEEAHPLWKWLKTQQGGFLSDDIKWNFTKFLIDKNGKVVARYAPTTEPNAMEDDIKALF